MTYLTRAYDDTNGNPVVVIVAEGRHDVSRIVHLFQRGNCEQIDLAHKMISQVRRHNAGREALKLLLSHGGTVFDQIDLDPQPVPGEETVTVSKDWFMRAMQIGVPFYQEASSRG